jgi:hypothetical protein
MSDFLDHLLGKGREGAGSLTPRPVSINERPAELGAVTAEPSSPSDGAPPGPPPAFAERGRGRQPALPGDQSQAAPQAGADDLHVRLDALHAWLARLDAREPEAPALAPGLPASTGPEPRGEAARQVRARLERPAPAAQPAEARPRAREIRPPTPDGSERALLKEAALVEPSPARRRERAEASLAPRDKEQAVAARPAPQPGPAVTARASKGVRAEVRPAAEVAPRLAPRPAETPRPAARRQKSPEVAPQPVVHVTIGTLEVRATRAPATQPAAQPPPAPNLSLEAYLRQRSRNGR